MATPVGRGGTEAFWSLAIAPDIRLSAGVPPAPRHEDGAEDDAEDGAGRTIVQVLGGRLRWRIGGSAEFDLPAATLCVVDTPSPAAHRLWSPDGDARCAVVRIGPAALPDHGGGDPRGGRGTAPVLLCREADSGLDGLVAQMLACPFHGPARRHYLTGKGLELTALGLLRASSGEALPQEFGPEPYRRQVCQARRILESSLDHPPRLRELARQVGLNPGRLSLEFRRAFGTTVHAHLREVRLTRAFHLLSAERVNASVVAHRVGYSAAHFSTAFRKRFGFPPSDLGGRSRLAGGFGNHSQ